jgi:hypothetical protein
VITAYLHEAGQGPQHFGHHQHTAASDHHEDASQDKPNLSKKTASHTHCSVCAHGVHSLDGVAESVFHPLLTSIAPMADVVHPSSSLRHLQSARNGKQPPDSGRSSILF